MADIIRFPLNELDLQPYNLTDDEKDRIVLVLQGKALKNPCQDDITRILAVLDTEYDLFEDLSSTHGSYSSSEITQIQRKLTDLQKAVNKFKTHTDIISGVALNYTGFPPNLLGRLGMARSYNSLRESLRKTKEGPCGVEESKSEIFSDMFKSILGYGETELERQIAFLDGIANKTDTTGIPNYSDLRSTLEGFVTTINAFKTNENNAFFKAYNFVLKVSLAQAVVNGPQDDFSDKLFEEAIGTKIFNTENIEALKIQCQTWFADSSTPPSDFTDNFVAQFALSSIADLVDINLDGVTLGDMLQYGISGFEVKARNELGLSLDDLTNVSGATTATHGQTLVYNSSTQKYSPGTIIGGSGGGGGSSFVFDGGGPDTDFSSPGSGIDFGGVV